MSAALPGRIEWNSNFPALEWDRQLALLGGHPLQTALWGDARSAVDGIADQRWAAAEPGGRVVLMARIEVRRIPATGRVAWIPKGPATEAAPSLALVHQEFLDRLRANGYLVCVEDPYPERFATMTKGQQVLPVPRTVLVDLSVGKDHLWAGLDSQWRYGVRASQRAGVGVTQTTKPSAISTFYGYCRRLSLEKGFVLPGSEALMRALCTAQQGPDAQAVLFVASYDGHFAAGALVMRCGPSAHYMWGATDRAFAKQRPGEAVHWAVIEWCLENRVHTYDLEGIDPQANRSTSLFKQKVGGREVILPGKTAYPLNTLGHIAVAAGKALGRL